MLNPYASFLGDRDPHQVIAATPGRLAGLTATPGRPPAPGKWDIRQILCHLADCEITFAFRLRQAAAEPNHVIQPFDQDRWAASYSGYSTSSALDVFRAVRQWNLSFIAAQPEEMMNQPVTHPERGAMTFRTIVETMAGHDLNHLRQIEALQ
jgi:hypothetical protein